MAPLMVPPLAPSTLRTSPLALPSSRIPCKNWRLDRPENQNALASAIAPSTHLQHDGRDATPRDGGSSNTLRPVLEICMLTRGATPELMCVPVRSLRRLAALDEPAVGEVRLLSIS